MDAYDYHKQFVEQTGSTIAQRTYLLAFDEEYAALEEIQGRAPNTRKRRAERRDATARALLDWYQRADDHHVARIVSHGTQAERAESLLTLLTAYRGGYSIMHAAAAVDRTRKGGE